MDIDESKGFIGHVFLFDTSTKADLVNILQYAIIAFIPLVILVKGMATYVPAVNPKKSSIEISGEIIIQLAVLFVGLFFINRIVTYVPTYSGIAYPQVFIVPISLVTMFILLSLHTKIGEKTALLVDRAQELWNGKKAARQGSSAGSNNGLGLGEQRPITQPMASLSGSSDSAGGTPISSLPADGSTQSLPDYNSMYPTQQTPLVGAATPGGVESFGPMPLMSGGAFGSPF